MANWCLSPVPSKKRVGFGAVVKSDFTVLSNSPWAVDWWCLSLPDPPWPGPLTSETFRKKSGVFQMMFNSVPIKCFFSRHIFGPKTTWKRHIHFPLFFKTTCFPTYREPWKRGDFLGKYTLWPTENHVLRLFNRKFEYRIVHVAQNPKLGYYDKIQPKSWCNIASYRSLRQPQKARKGHQPNI